MRVNKINWDKIGRMTEPGRYKCFFGYLTVTSDDIEVWTRYPDATFTLIEGPTTEQSVGEDYPFRRVRHRRSTTVGGSPSAMSIRLPLAPTSPRR